MTVIVLVIMSKKCLLSDSDDLSGSDNANDKLIDSDNMNEII